MDLTGRALVVVINWWEVLSSWSNSFLFWTKSLAFSCLTCKTVALVGFFRFRLVKRRENTWKHDKLDRKIDHGPKQAEYIAWQDVNGRPPTIGKLSQNQPLTRRKVLQSIIFHDWHLGRFPVHFHSEQPTRVDEKVTSRRSTSSIDDALPHVRSGHDLTPERSKFCFHVYAIFVNHVQASSLTFLRFVKSDFGNQSIWLASWGISC